MRGEERRGGTTLELSLALFCFILIARSAECFPPTSPNQLRWWATHSNTSVHAQTACASFHKFKPCVEEGGDGGKAISCST